MTDIREELRERVGVGGEGAGNQDYSSSIQAPLSDDITEFYEI